MFWIWTLISRNLKKSICSTLGTLGQLRYTIIVFKFDLFSFDSTVNIGPKHHLLSLYTHGWTGNIFFPTFWHNFHIFCILAITTAVGTMFQSRSIIFKVLFKAVEPYIYIDCGCWTVKAFMIGCQKQCQSPLQHMWGRARLCKRQAATTTMQTAFTKKDPHHFSNLSEDETHTRVFLIYPTHATSIVHDNKRLVHLTFTQLSLDMSLKYGRNLWSLPRHFYHSNEQNSPNHHQNTRINLWSSSWTSSCLKMVLQQNAALWLFLCHEWKFYW